jgi:putative tryptophan/tyrosine transport system substrate-binding protein
MSKKIILILTTFLLTTVSISKGQPQNKVAQIGYLDARSSLSDALRTEAFRQGLRNLGYVDGKNVVIEYRYAEGNLDRLPALVAELVRLKVDVIVTGGATVTRAVMKATTTIPIVMAQDPDPVGNGFVASLARPGGNVTGLSSLTADLSGKRLELLKEILSQLSHVAILGTSTNPANAQQQKETELAAAAFKVKIQYLDVLSSKDIESAFRAANKERADGVIQLSGPLLSSQITQIPKLAIRNRLPVIYDRSEFVNEGGLMSYGASRRDLDRRAATYVDKILRGAKPAELPVEQPTKFELIINLKAAKQIGLTIPPNVLARADRVIR